MKKFTAISSILLGLGILFSTTVQASIPMMSDSETRIERSDISLEKEIGIQDWMLSFEKRNNSLEAGVEKELKLESWMLDLSWTVNTDEVIAEAEIPLEDWMTASFSRENRIMALDL
jgi:hypothetical protein